MRSWLLVCVGAVIGGLGVLGWLGFQGGYQAHALAPAKASIEKLLATSKTILGQPIVYPTDGDAKVTAVIVTMPPGAQTGWHFHEVPLFGYILEGELTVTYKGHGQKVYRKGDSLMEAIETHHDGKNLGGEPVRILAVFMGGGGLKNSVRLGPGIK
ncbi:MAG: cupin domain-containing protein [Pseudomonadota bacterium]